MKREKKHGKKKKIEIVTLTRGHVQYTVYLTYRDNWNKELYQRHDKMIMLLIPSWYFVIVTILVHSIQSW